MEALPLIPQSQMRASLAKLLPVGDRAPKLKVYCPECGHLMGAAGTANSGRNRVPRWRCSKCLRTTIKPISEGEQLMLEALEKIEERAKGKRKFPGLNGY